MSLLEVREQLVDVVELTSRLPCTCTPSGGRCLACRALDVLGNVRAFGLRVKRWRNELEAPVSTVHVAGDVDVSRERRPSYPTGFIVDRWQACTSCGETLVRGRWAVFFDVGDLVSVLAPRDGLAGVPVLARGGPGEVPCWQLPGPDVTHPGEPSTSATPLHPGMATIHPVGGRVGGMRYVAYLRVSTQGQADDGQGLEVQRHEIRAWARKGKHRLVEIATDAGVSGAADVANRPGLAHAIALVLAEQADGIVVHRLDRLARDVVLQETILADLHRIGAQLHSTSASEDEHLVDDPQDPTRALVRRILGAVASYERDLIRLRLRAGRDRKASAGGYIGGKPPLGWRASRGTLVEHPEEQITLAIIHELHAQGCSTRAIAAELERRGRVTKTGRASWTPSAVGRAITPRSNRVLRPNANTPTSALETA